MLLCITGCGNSKNPKSIYDKDKQVITLGMSRSEIDAKLGQGNREGDIVCLYDHNTVFIVYKKNISTSIMLTTTSTNTPKYNDFKGNRIGDDINKCREKIDQKYIISNDGKDNFFLFYYKDNKLIEKNNNKGGYKSSYGISYSTDKNSDKLHTILMTNKK